MQNTAEDPQWYARLPVPTRAAPLYKKEDLLRQFAILGDILNAGTLLIDVRRTDYEGGAIRGSLNLPAQSFHMNMSTLYRLCKGDGMNVISRVMFYCGSSNGRGPRCAAWFADYVAARGAEEGIPETMHEPRVFVLEGGIKGWVAGGPPYRQCINDYDENYWMQFDQVKTAGKRTADVSMDESGWDGEDTEAKRMRSFG